MELWAEFMQKRQAERNSKNVTERNAGSCPKQADKKGERIRKCAGGDAVTGIDQQ